MGEVEAISSVQHATTLSINPSRDTDWTINIGIDALGYADRHD